MALEAVLQSHLWRDYEMELRTEGTNQGQEQQDVWGIQGQSWGRTAECLCLWQGQEKGQHKDTQGRFVRTCSHEDTVPMSLGATQGASPGQSLTSSTQC